MSLETIGIGMIGCGTVGQGVVRLLEEQAEVYANRVGATLEIKRILVRDTSRQRDVSVDASLMTDDADAFFETPGMSILVEVAGGIEPTLSYIKRALENGMHVVSANKHLLAVHGAEIYSTAREHEQAVAFEASCAGGIPILQALKFGLGANRIDALYGILNGTCNYILSKMTVEGTSYQQALEEAQAAGFAEADPTMDVNGADTAQKLAIIASLAFGVHATEDDVTFEGIENLDLTDIYYGQELGYTVKLLAIGRRVDDQFTLRVHPCFIHSSDIIAQVQGSFNAMSVFGHAVGHTLYFGRGAGQMPTASAVVGDLLNVASGWYPHAFKHSKIWPDQQVAISPANADEVRTRFYLRVMVKNQPGVMARLTNILAQHTISISAILQHEHEVDGYVPVVVTTDKAPQGDMFSAVQEIGQLDILTGDPVCLRIVDFPNG